jgi:chaperone modulatory protein CbpM
MTDERDDVMWMHAQHEITIVELAQASGLTEAVVRELVEYGALVPRDPRATQWSFSATYVATVRKAARLGTDLELETPVMALLISFLERINQLEDEVRRLDAQRVR